MILPSPSRLQSQRMLAAGSAPARDREFRFYLTIARPMMCAQVAARVRDKDLREDIVQEITIRLFRFLPRLSSPRHFGAWLHRIVRNQVATSLRTQCRRREVSCDFLEEVAGTPDEDGGEGTNPFAVEGRSASPRGAAARQELMSDLRGALTALPPRQRSAFEQFALEERSIAEVAADMKCSEGAVKFHIHAARAKLRDLLRDHLVARAA